MADFSDGVKEYIEAEGKIRNFFPVDWKGNKDWTIVNNLDTKRRKEKRLK